MKEPRMAKLSVTDEMILKAHTGTDGQIWFLDGDRLPESSGMSTLAFLKSTQVQKADRIRVLGTPENADLIVKLYAMKLGDRLGSVEVCSPLACESRARRARPEHVLFDMRRWGGCPSRGGWHEFGPLDYPSYALCVGIQQGVDHGHLSHVLRDHPAWYALRGIPHLKTVELCRLVASILDPRFFIDPDDPDRLSKLEAFIGLEPKIAVVEGKTDAASKQHARYRSMLACWKCDDPGNDAAMDQPELFVWKAYYEAGGGWKGDLRAGQRFLQYLRHTWLDAMYPEKPWGEPLFVPKHFFGSSGVRWFRKQVRLYK